MKRSLLLTIFFLLAVTTVKAEVVYVSDVMEITLRTGPGTDHKIMAMIASGQQANVLRQEQSWSKIKLPDGKEGWVLSRFLSREPSNKSKLEDLNKMHEALKLKTTPLIEENARLKKENRSLTELAKTKNHTNEELRLELEGMKKNRTIRWFLAGGGVLLLGFLIGLSARPKRRKSSLL